MISIINVFAQDSITYGLKLPTEDELKSIPYTPAFQLPSGTVLPNKIDLSIHMPPVKNQGSQGSCTAFAVAYALKSFHEKMEFNWSFIEGGNIRYDRVCSPAFVFNVAKRMIGDYNCKNGISFFEAFKVLQDYGTPFWNDYPYDESNCSNQPSQTVASKAIANKISTHRRVNHKNIDEIRYNISVNNPIIIGVIPDDFFQPDGFDAYRNGRHYTFIPKGILNPNNYHAMVCVGYDDNSRTFKVMNSWGTNWGNAGYVDIPYAWFTGVVHEAYIMNDAYRYNLFVDSKKRQIENINTKSDSIQYSSWVKRGYYREFKNLKFGLAELDSKAESAYFVVSDAATNEDIFSARLENNESQTIQLNNQRITLKLTDVGRAGKNPLTKAAFFSVIVSNVSDIELKEQLADLQLINNQKLLINQLMQQQNQLIEH
ncbi:C1 family peptidase [Pontibacter chinhatensis]|nr:C1 family peptidase [Pontibacter chinhatensis]